MHKTSFKNSKKHFVVEIYDFFCECVLQWISAKDILELQPTVQHETFHFFFATLSFVSIWRKKLILSFRRKNKIWGLKIQWSKLIWRALKTFFRRFYLIQKFFMINLSLLSDVSSLDKFFGNSDVFFIRNFVN